MLVCTQLNAQLSNGSNAPDWTMTDINGVEYNLHTVLASGKSVVLEFSTTWCSYCWNYHNTHTLEDLNQAYGPNGTDQIRVFFIESDDDTNLDCLLGQSGCNDFSYGDWTEGTSFTFFNPSSPQVNQIQSDYQVPGYPTLYGISPIDNTTRLIGQASYATWESWLIDSWQMSATANVTDGDCSNGGMIDLVVEHGFGSLSYSWSNGATTQDISNLDEGYYSVTITDAHNVSIQVDDIFVNSGANIVAQEETIVHNECNGGANGSISVSMSGGEGALTYSWSNGQTGSSIFNLTAGFYSVVCSDGTGCEAEFDYEVVDPAAIQIQVDDALTTCGENNGHIEVVVTDPNPPFLYTLEGTQQSSQHFYNLAPGSYEVEVENSLGCTETQSFSVIESDELVAVITSSGTQLDCNVSSIELSAEETNPNGPASYIWTDESGNTIGHSMTLNVDVAGTYTVQVTELLYECVATSSINIVADEDIPMAQIADPGTIDCNNATVNLDGSASSNAAGTTYLWTTTDGTISGDATQAQVEVSSGGTYSLQVTNAQGCIATETTVVTSDTNAPTASLTSSGIIDCNTTMVQVCATTNENNTIAWQLAEGVQNTSCIEVSSAGTYQAVISAANGCSTTESIEVMQDSDVPDLSVTSSGDITCDQNQVELCASIQDGNSLVWTDANGNVLGETTCVMVSAAGAYNATVSSSNGCQVIEQISVMQDSQVPTVSLTSTGDITCDQSEVEICAQTNESNQIIWTDASGAVQGTNSCITVTVSGQYAVEVQSANGCNAVQSMQVDQMTEPTSFSLASSSNLSCSQTMSTLSISDFDMEEVASIRWLNADGALIAEEASETTINAAGSYFVELVNNRGCVSMQSINVEFELEELMPEINVTANSGGEIIATYTSDMEGTISWTLPDGSVVSQNDISVNVDENGSYSICLNIVNDCGEGTICETVDILLLTMNVESNHITCFGAKDGSANLNISGGIPEYQVQWEGPNGFASNEMSLSDLAEGDYTAVISDATGFSLSQTVMILEPAQIEIVNAEVVNDMNSEANGSINLEVIGGYSPYTYVWSNGESTANISNLTAGTYTLQVTDANGCTAEVSLDVDNVSSAIDLEQEWNLRIYPVPSIDNINIQANLPSEHNVLKVKDVTGKQIWQSNLSKGSLNHTINVSNWDSGLYLLSIHSDSKVYQRKVIVVK